MNPLDETKHPKSHHYNTSELASALVPLNDSTDGAVSRAVNRSTKTLAGTQIQLHNIPKVATLHSAYRTEEDNNKIKYQGHPDQLHPQATRSEPSHLDWKLQDSLRSYGINPHKETTMAEHRAAHPKPALFDLIHQWNLSDTQQSQLDYYKLASMTAAQLENALADNYNKIYQRESNRIYIPIYQYTTRTQIKFDSCGRSYRAKYYLSFRSTGDTNIVLIQRSRNATL